MLEKHIENYHKSNNEDIRMDLIEKISFSDSKSASSFLCTVAWDTSKDAEERAFAIEKLIPHPTGQKEFEKVLELFKLSDNPLIREWCAQFIGLHGLMDKETATLTVNCILQASECDDAINGILTDIGIRGRKIINVDQLNKISHKHGNESIAFTLREWKRQ